MTTAEYPTRTEKEGRTPHKRGAERGEHKTAGPGRAWEVDRPVPPSPPHETKRSGHTAPPHTQRTKAAKLTARARAQAWPPGPGAHRLPGTRRDARPLRARAPEDATSPRAPRRPTSRGRARASRRCCGEAESGEAEGAQTRPSSAHNATASHGRARGAQTVHEQWRRLDWAAARKSSRRAAYPRGAAREAARRVSRRRRPERARNGGGGGRARRRGGRAIARQHHGWAAAARPAARSMAHARNTQQRRQSRRRGG